MALIVIDHHPDSRQLKLFALIWLPLFLALVGGLVLHQSGSLPAALGVWLPGLLICALGYWHLGFMRLVFLGLLYAVYPIGWLVSHLLLGAIYYGLMTPLGLVLRLAGRDPLTRQLDPAAASYWVERGPPAKPGAYFRQF